MVTRLASGARVWQRDVRLRSGSPHLTAASGDHVLRAMADSFRAATALFAVALLACSDRNAIARQAKREPCPFTGSDVRLTSATVGGMAISITLGELRDRCPDARPDTEGVGGIQPVALTLEAPGVVLSAVQTKHEALDESVHGGEPADLWVAMGDSLRFPDGRLIPRTVGALRALDSVGVVIIDHGDDGTGSYVVLCAYQHLALIVDNAWPTIPDTGVVRFATISVSDTTRIWRVELGPFTVDRRVPSACARAPVT